MKPLYRKTLLRFLPIVFNLERANQLISLGFFKSNSAGHWSNRGENSGTFSLKMGKTPHPTPTKNFFSIT
ncbi:MAG: hypothetical protein EWV67_10430 [Microcystis sp. M_QC_C_20170808_M2Col]|nr:MAG: hypothetical protein EWV67_10430 [Microcystis sp. M_QC_C_20170808_M2Col]